MPAPDLKSIVTSAITIAAHQAATATTTNTTKSDVPTIVAMAEEAAKPRIQEAQARIDYITNNESLVQSWSFNSAWVAVLSSALTIYGALSDGYQANVDQLVLVGAGGTLLSAAGWLIGRIRGKPIGQ